MIPIEPALTRCIYFVSHREEETFVQIFGEID